MGINQCHGIQALCISLSLLLGTARGLALEHDGGGESERGSSPDGDEREHVAVAHQALAGDGIHSNPLDSAGRGPVGARRLERQEARVVDVILEPVAEQRLRGCEQPRDAAMRSAIRPAPQAAVRAHAAPPSNRAPTSGPTVTCTAGAPRLEYPISCIRRIKHKIRSIDQAISYYTLGRDTRCRAAPAERATIMSDSSSARWRAVAARSRRSKMSAWRPASEYEDATREATSSASGT